MNAPYSIVNAETDELIRVQRDCRASIALIVKKVRHWNDRVVVTPGSDTLRRVWLHYGGKAHMLVATNDIHKANAVRQMAEAVALGRVGRG